MIKADPKRVGERIYQIRINHGLTMEEFGKLFQTSKATVNNWEKGRNLPNKNNLKSISRFGDIPVNELLYGKESEIVNNTMEIERVALGHYLLKIKEINIEENKVTETQVQLDFETLANLGRIIDDLLENDHFESIAEVIHELGKRD